MGGVKNLQLPTYLPNEDFYFVIHKSTPQYFLSAFGRHPIIIRDTNKANYV